MTRQFVVAVILTVPLTIAAMWHHLGDLPSGALGAVIGFVAKPLVQLALTVPVFFYSGRGFFKGTWYTLRNRTADMNTRIAIGLGTDVAIEAADVALIRNDVMDVARAVALSRATTHDIRQNLFFVFIYSGLGIPVVAGVLYPSSA